MGKIIGIDLGTTTSEIAFMENDQPKIITDCFGNRIVPSVVGKKEDGTVVVGQVAYNQLISSPDRTMAEVKRLMGSDTMISLDDEKYLPHELSSLILKELKKYAEDYLGEEVVEAVITVPANFNNSQRKVTKMAGEMAGLKVERIINEPTAAAMAYGLNNYDKEEKILVYDLGGGTFDVSILEMFEGILDVKSSRGNDRLGGKDFDSRIEKYIEKEFEKTYNQNLYKGLDVKNKLSIKLRVKEAAINAKKELSTQLSTTINIPFITIIDNKPVSIGMELTRDKFNQLTKDLVISTTEKIDEALKAAKLKEKDIDRVLLIGGSSRIPAVKELVEKKFKGKIITGINPDEAVAMGAAIQAGIKGNQITDVENLIITDKCSYNLGTSIIKIGDGKVISGAFDCIIPIDSSIPCSNKKTYYTAVDNQDEVRIEVFEGNEEMAEDNVKIGDFILKGIPKGKAGEQSIDVQFDYDLNGILEVKATIVSTGKSINKIIDNFKLTKLPIDSLADENMYYRYKVDSWQEYELAESVKNIIELAEKKMKHIKDEDKYDEIENILDELKMAVIYNNKELVEKFDDELTDILFED
ncbi:MAG: Hsp70 family protein [Clostridiales bacterium]|uniref:Hsp70 family protein n=1 Tax=Terrisporobacter sp. TaxID=1965305 RepID=UPI0025CD2E73|nr:Hsp70 family protein [Terrisporobacter sp.]MCI6459669.1 Hsp70 family protein [Clostridium sp.]MDD5879487.1 Hsp70 family protein [Clostridiales bacterium]MCI7207570.1 Hsp70 family protein [Clostridium sp.]MDD7755949.1 Hsp70 family protein [Clostridiales bacterium]MDY4133871.1 Hsp70 family protein [Terrisporobacter sp.]